MNQCYKTKKNKVLKLIVIREDLLNRLVINDRHFLENDMIVVQDPAIMNHIQAILKLSTGDPIKLCLVNDGLATGKILSIEHNKIEIQVLKKESGLSPLASLMIGACRPPTVKKLLEHGTSLGASSFHFVKAKLSEKSYLNSKVLEQAEQYLKLGLAQSGQYYQLPKVLTSLYLPDSENQQKYFLSLNTDKYLIDYKIDLNTIPLFSLGPERGWTKEEEQLFLDRGFKPLKISDCILRIEIATFSLLGQLHLIKNKLRLSL